MNDLRRKLAIAKSLERLRKLDLDEKLTKSSEAKQLVRESRSKVNVQQTLINNALSYANETQEQCKSLKSFMLETQSEYFSSLYADLEDIKGQLRDNLGVYTECQDGLILAHAKKRLASKNIETIENEKSSRQVKQDGIDNFTPNENFKGYLS